ncbi:serine/threonine-protein kinase [Thermostilla marina]
MKIERLGPYRLVRKLGRGGMGTVFEGVHDETGEPAAVKMLSFSLAEEEDFRVRFETEIETLKKLRHPNIVRLLGFGEQDGILFYAMELVDGPSLEDEIRRGRVFHWREVLDFAIQIGQALRHAHDRGVIHRDIKPANLLLASDAVVKLSDFGIARLFGNTRQTAAGSVLGTIEYMSPEQAAGVRVDPRSDLYSLGGVMYALLAGRPPFRSKVFAEMLRKHRTETPEPVRRYAPDVPAELERIIAELLAKKPEDRVANALLLTRRLQAMKHALSPERLEKLAESRREAIEHQLEEIDPSQGPLTFGVPGERDQTNPGAEPTLDVPDKPESSEATLETSFLRKLAEDAAAEADRPTGEYTTDAAGESPEDASAATRAEAQPASDGPSTDAATSAVSPGISDSTPRKVSETAASGEKGNAEAADSGGTKRAGSSRFVVVTEEDLDRFEVEPIEKTPIFSLRTGVLVAGLVAIAGFVWYMLQPVDADTLYDRIQAKVADRSESSLLEAEDDITDFLSRFPGDRRAPLLREYASEIELIRLERRLQFRLRHEMTNQVVVPIERDYLDALRLAEEQPEEAIEKLRALIDLYGTRADSERAESNGDDPRPLPNSPRERCVELARRRLSMLEQQLEPVLASHRESIIKRLDYADSIAATHPIEAAKIRHAVIELYGDRSWASDLVDRARAALGEQPSAEDELAEPSNDEAAADRIGSEPASDGG